MKSPFLALVRNDLRLFFADKRALVATLCVPVGIASFSVAARASVGAGKTAVALIIWRGLCPGTL